MTDMSMLSRQRLERDLSLALQALEDIAEGREYVQCLMARLGEMTQECDIQKPCVACRAALNVETT